MRRSVVGVWVCDVYKVLHPEWTCDGSKGKQKKNISIFWYVLFTSDLGRPRKLPSNTLEHAPFPRISEPFLGWTHRRPSKSDVTAEIRDEIRVLIKRTISVWLSRMSYCHGTSQEESREVQPSGDSELLLKAFLQVSQKLLKCWLCMLSCEKVDCSI